MNVYLLEKIIARGTLLITQCKRFLPRVEPLRVSQQIFSSSFFFFLKFYILHPLALDRKVLSQFLKAYVVE